MSKNEQWSKLDNTAKVFPAISGEHAANVFRLWATLNEEIDPVILEQAVNIAKKEVPSFNVKMRRGLFWYYFEPNNNTHKVTMERNFPCSKIDIRRNQWFLFKVTYYKNRINLEVFHALADGSGGMYFLNHIIYHYLRLMFPDDVSAEKPPELKEISKLEMDEDGYLKSYDPNTKLYKQKMVKAPKAYKIDGSLVPWGNQLVMEICVPTTQIIAMTKAKGVTVAEYFIALTIYSIYEERFKKSPEDRDIIISVPVNLRSFFDSKTLKNFFIFVRIGINFYEKNYGFDEVLELVVKQMKAQVQKELFMGRIKQQIELEKKWAFRIIPRIVKDFALKILYKSGESGYTCTFTNMGRVKVNENISKYIKEFGTLLGASRNNVFKIALTSFENQMIFSFNSTIYETDIQKYFVNHLSENGIDVTLSCNEVGSQNEIL